MEPYKDKGWLYEQYVKKRRNLTDICQMLESQYNLKVTPQTVYNWCEKYDLLKFRGKGRNLKKRTPTNAQSLRVVEYQKAARKRRDAVRKGMRRGK